MKRWNRAMRLERQSYGSVFYGKYGVLKIKEKNKIVFENPGYIRLGKEQMRRGGKNGIPQLEENQKKLMENPSMLGECLDRVKQIMSESGCQVLSEMLDECNIMPEDKESMGYIEKTGREISQLVEKNGGVEEEEKKEEEKRCFSAQEMIDWERRN